MPPLRALGPHPDLDDSVREYSALFLNPIMIGGSCKGPAHLRYTCHSPQVIKAPLRTLELVVLYQLGYGPEDHGLEISCRVT